MTNMKVKEKIKYEIDPLNRLILTGTGKKSKLPKFRKVIDGKIKIDKDNTFTEEKRGQILYL